MSMVSLSYKIGRDFIINISDAEIVSRHQK